MAFQNPYAQKITEFPNIVYDEERFSVFFNEPVAALAGAKKILEIGCSNAFFLTDIAALHPLDHFFGIDWKYKAIFNGARKIHREKIDNVVLFRGHVHDLIDSWLATVDSRFLMDEVWIFFPDPWAKKSQLKHRIFQADFLVRLAAILKPGGRICFKTDHPGYFAWALSIFGKSPEVQDQTYDLNAAKAKSGADRNKKIRQIIVRKNESTEELPGIDLSAVERFEVTKVSSDYWSNPTISTERYFASVPTLFEKLFLQDELKIYYLELLKK